MEAFAPSCEEQAEKAQREKEAAEKKARLRLEESLMSWPFCLGVGLLDSALSSRVFWVLERVLGVSIPAWPAASELFISEVSKPRAIGEAKQAKKEAEKKGPKLLIVFKSPDGGWDSADPVVLCLELSATTSQSLNVTPTTEVCKNRSKFVGSSCILAR